MQMDFGTVTPPSANTIQNGYDSVGSEVKSDNVAATKDVSAVTKLSISGEVKAPKDEGRGIVGKKPTEKSIDAAFSEMNAKMKEQKTRCEYSYDEDTKRISISVYDKESDELIREIPPEESLEVLQKVLELAGMVVDEKR